MKTQYPNLKLLEYIFNNFMNQAKYHGPREVDAFVFPQMWGNTAGGNAEPGQVAGQSFIKEYTTVMFCPPYAMVAFGDTPAYMVSNPNEAFMEDFEKRCMRPKRESEKVYAPAPAEKTEELKEKEDGKESST